MNNKNILLNKRSNLNNYNRQGKFIFFEFTKELIRNYSPEEILKIKNTLQEKQILNEELENKRIEESLKKEYLNAIQKETPLIINKEKTPVFIKKEDKSFRRKEENYPNILEKEETQEVKKEWFSPINSEGKSLVLKKEKEFPDMSVYRRPIESSLEKNSFKELKLIIPETKFPIHLQYIRPVPMNKEINLDKLNPLINDRFVQVIECYGPNENIFVKGAMGVKKTGITLTDEEIKGIINKFSEETRIPAHEGVFKVASGRLLFSAIVSETVGSKFIISKIPSEQAQNYRAQNPAFS
jgi:hypothetical protein